MSRRLRILVPMHEALVPPDSIEGLTDKQIKPWKTEYDVVTALLELGHDVRKQGLADDLGVLRQAIEDFRPHICFNLMEEFHGVGIYDTHVVSYLELMKRRYTGCNPRGLMLAHDKALSKQILHYHRIGVPDHAVFAMDRKVRRPKSLGFPLIVKSLTEEGSLGIAQASLVHDDAQLAERVEFVHRQIGTDAIAEQFIEGRELYIGILGNQRLETFPAWEFRMRDPGTPLIATSRVKWDYDYQEKKGIVWERADLSPELRKRLENVAKRTYRILRLTGYARIDLRVDADERAYVLEANPNPDLGYGSEFAESAEAVGLDYPDLLQRIVNLGLRYRAQWQEDE